MDCKKALTESEGDMEKAVDWLRAKGNAGASRAQNAEKHGGLIGVRDTSFDGHDDGLVLVEVNSETDFVGHNENFHLFVKTTDQVIQKRRLDELELKNDGKVDHEALLQADGGAMQNMLTDAVNVIKREYRFETYRNCTKWSWGSTFVLCAWRRSTVIMVSSWDRRLRS